MAGSQRHRQGGLIDGCLPLNGLYVGRTNGGIQMAPPLVAPGGIRSVLRIKQNMCLGHRPDSGGNPYGLAGWIYVVRIPPGFM